MTIYKATITSDCTCEIYDEEADETLLNEYGDPKRPENCYGDCYTNSKDDFLENLVKPFAHQVQWQLDDPIRVDVDRIGWRNQSAYAMTTLERLVDTLTINGDFTLEFEYDDELESLTARRYSHDEPVGTGVFELTHYLPCQTCGEPVQADIHKEELGFCVECQHRYFDHKDD